jgi:uridylate kinase
MKTVVLSLGGSIIVPDKPDYFFLSEFKNFIIRHLDKYRFIIVCGGGKINSYYNHAATRISNVKEEDLDWIGIMATRLNGELVRAIFGELAYSRVIYDPHEEVTTEKNIIVAAGWNPGCSTDMDAVILAKRYDAQEVINLSNISHVYNKDPNKFQDAEKLHSLTWDEYRKMVGHKWIPRLNSPFDPIASKEAHIHNIRVVILKGTDLKNLENYFEKRAYEGTIIE